MTKTAVRILDVNVDKLVLGLTGMPGSGKSIVVQAAKELGYEVVTMGDVIREETAKRGRAVIPTWLLSWSDT